MPATRTFAPFSSAGDLLELGVDLERVGEQHPPVADQEQPDGEQQDAADHECANRGESTSVPIDPASPGVLSTT